MPVRSARRLSFVISLSPNWTRLRHMCLCLRNTSADEHIITMNMEYLRGVILPLNYNVKKNYQEVTSSPTIKIRLPNNPSLWKPSISLCY
jgi:hypothetical protein